MRKASALQFQAYTDGRFAVGRIARADGMGCHLYEIEADKDGKRVTVDVEANNRSHAAKYAESMGYAVRSVNMVG